jgi:hypothetical protein
MSEQTLCIVLTVLVIVLMLVWVPILEFFCPRCSHAIRRLFRNKAPQDVRQRDAAGTKAQHG